MDSHFEFGDGNKQMTLNTAEQLIREVANTPVLWNRYHNDYNNRNAMDSEWDRIAGILNKEKDFVKQKWRNLRDQFQREIKKVKVPFDNPTKPYIQYYRGKWLYFEQMLFLREGAAKRPNSCFSPSHEIEIHEEDIIKEELIVFEDSDDVFAEQANIYSNDSDSNDRHSDTVYSVRDTQSMNCALLIQPKIEIIEEDQKENKEFKRKISRTNSEADVAAKVKKVSVADASSNTEVSGDIDDDLHFVKSLVPYLRKLSPIRKLLVRNEIQNLLIRESLCKNCKLGKS